MKLLFFAPSPQSNTGYGVTLRNVAAHLIAAGHTVKAFGYNGHPAGILDIGGMTVYPRAITLYDSFPDIVAMEKPDRIVVLCDPWIVKGERWQKLAADHDVAFWFPVQSYPPHPDFLAVTRHATRRLVYSDWGTRIMIQAGQDAEHVPLGYSPDTYQPMDKTEARAWFSHVIGKDVGTNFIAGMVAANTPTIPDDRKGFAYAFRAFARLLADVPQALLYLHTVYDDRAGGYDLKYMAQALGILDHVITIPPVQWYIGPDENWMARMYAALDVLLAPSRCEGFGMPHVEAQACGTPVVTTKFSSITELVHYGCAVSPLDLDYHPSIAGGHVAIPDAMGVYRAMLDIHAAGRVQLTRPLPELERYQWANVTARLLEALD